MLRKKVFETTLNVYINDSIFHSRVHVAYTRAWARAGAHTPEPANEKQVQCTRIERVVVTVVTRARGVWVLSSV